MLNAPIGRGVPSALPFICTWIEQGSACKRLSDTCLSDVRVSMSIEARYSPFLEKR